MKIEIVSIVPANREDTWSVIMDIPKAASCIPGINEVTSHGEGHYSATLKAKIGPMGLTLAGTITVVSQDDQCGEAEILVEANDRRVGGGVKTNMIMKITPKTAHESELVIKADTTFMGRLGELGQPIIRRKARNTLEDFTKNLSELLAP